MMTFVDVGYGNTELRQLNTVRKFKNMIHLSDLVVCDGTSLDGQVLTDTRTPSRLHIFPVEYPARADFKLWNKAIQVIMPLGLRLPTSLGKFLIPTH